jgi:hypothetical protein
VLLIFFLMISYGINLKSSHLCPSSKNRKCVNLLI